MLIERFVATLEEVKTFAVPFWCTWKKLQVVSSLHGRLHRRVVEVLLFGL